MKEAWPDCAGSYRSRSRKKKQEFDRLSALERKVRLLEEKQTNSTSQQRPLEDPRVDAAPSQPRGSVGSSHLEGCGAYPVDYVTEKTDCELHVPMRNISVKVADGYVYPPQEGATHHHLPIPAVCALVGVDSIVTGYETMELDFPGGEEEKTLGDVQRSFALWNKKYIIFSDPQPRPPPPEQQRPSTSPGGSPREEQRPSNPPAGSPREEQRPWTPPAGSPHEHQSPDLPKREPSASPSSRYQKAPAKRNGTPSRKRPRTEKAAPPVKKLPWDNTIEENKEAVRAQMAAHFAPKVPEVPFVQTLDPVKKAHTVENLYNPPPSPPSDYRRSIEISYDEMVEAKKGKQVPQVVQDKKGKQVPQLGEQPVQSVPPLKVFDEKPVESSQKDTTDYPMAKVVYQFVQGADLVENKSTLGTLLRNLHQWYKMTAEQGIETFMVGVREEHYFQEYSVSVDFRELFQLYNLRAIDKSIVSCYCL